MPISYLVWGLVVVVVTVFKGLGVCLFVDVGKRGIKGSKVNISQSSKLMSQLVTHFPSPTTLVAKATCG